MRKEILINFSVVDILRFNYSGLFEKICSERFTNGEMVIVNSFNDGQSLFFYTKMRPTLVHLPLSVFQGQV